MKQVHPGIWKIRFGTPEKVTPVKLRHRKAASKALTQMGDVPCPFAEGAITATKTARGMVLRVPLGTEEQFYGLGLQLLSHAQRGLKKTLRVNSDPIVDMGDSHAPVPFYVSTAGYGVLVDTARYATFYMGSLVGEEQAETAAPRLGKGAGYAVGGSDELYVTRKKANARQVVVEIPLAKGVDVYIFGGPAMREAVQRYNLFSGGGCVPPRWGLGVWYRCHGQSTQEAAAALAKSLRADEMPCDVFGLEPGWQSNAYPCTWMFGPRFPQPAEFVKEMTAAHYRVNLWTHVFVHPDNPNFAALRPHSGDFLAFNGLVPDLTQPAVRQILTDHHEREHVALGVSGYKIDECDNSDFITRMPWSFPECSSYPSGIDGEQLHSLLGINYQEALEKPFQDRDQRTYGQVRNSHALAAPYPFVLYSDLYKHEDFIRGLVNSGFSGLLWSPEVRDAADPQDLIRRLQVVCLSPQALINAWYITSPPWKNWITPDNNAGKLAEGWEQLQNACREILKLRMTLVPYLHAAFYEYFLHGLPPFRALAMDWPEDINVHKIDNQYMMGDRIMVAPLTAASNQRSVYLPAGTWYDFWTGAEISGGQTLTVDFPLDRVPMYVKGDAILPLAQ